MIEGRTGPGRDYGIAGRCGRILFDHCPQSERGGQADRPLPITFYVPALSGLPRFIAQTLRAPPFWMAELLEDLPLDQRPAPFAEVEHTFPTLETLCEWLGDPEVKSNFGRSAVARSRSAYRTRCYVLLRQDPAIRIRPRPSPDRGLERCV
jgi:hypothetical protein